MSRRWWWRLTMAVAALAVAPPLAWAAGAHGDEHAEPSIWAGDLGNVVWTWVIFLTVVFVLRKFAWRPLLGALQKREEFIRESLENARKEREEAKKLLEQYTEQINKAREEASALCDEGRRDAEEVRRRIESEARAEADRIVKRAKREIEIAHQDAIKEIYNEVADLATRVAGRVLEREVSADDHRQLVSSAVEEYRQKGQASSN